MRVIHLAGMLAFTLLLLETGVLPAARFGKAEGQRQNQIFRKHWGRDLNWRFDDLPVSGSVPNSRLPYAGSIYPDRQGGTHRALRKYDQAFHAGRPLAVTYERHDIKVHQQPIPAGPFGILSRRGTPEWAGHCNGWAAAAIRHAEPKKNVTAGRGVFTPADIKGLLAEIYVYGEIDELGGTHGVVNPGILHVMLANWIGRGQHAIAMDSTPGEEIWNYPIYAYQSSSVKQGRNVVDVNVNIGYVDYTEQEHNKAPKNYEFMSFHYRLQLDAQGNILGGSYFRDSARIDLLWVPLSPTRKGSNGETNRNPHVNIKTVLSLWRASADEDLRRKWVTIDPTRFDRVTMNRPRERVSSQPPRSRRTTVPRVEIDDSDSSVSEPVPSVARGLRDYIFVR